MAAYENKIFAFDKTNKYREDIVNVRNLTRHKTLLSKIMKGSLEITLNMLTEKESFRPVDIKLEAKQYFENPIKRSEFLHDSMLSNLVLSQLLESELEGLVRDERLKELEGDCL